MSCTFAFVVTLPTSQGTYIGGPCRKAQWAKDCATSVLIGFLIVSGTLVKEKPLRGIFNVVFCTPESDLISDTELP